MREYINFLRKKHRATQDSWIRQGKTYRSRFVAYENGYIQALRDVQDAIDQPEKNRQLSEVMVKFADRLKG